MNKRTLKALGLAVAVILAGTAAVFLVSPEKRRLTDEIRGTTGFEYIRLSEGVTEYETAGPADGTPVILVHGMSVPMYDWDRQVPYLADRGYRVIRYNQYGRAYSDRPRGTYDRARYVRQLSELMDALGIERAHLVAHSMGGGVAASFAAAHPEKTDRIVLISPVFHMAEDHGGIAAVRMPLFGGILAKTALPGMLADRAEGLFREAGIPEADAYDAAFREQTKYAGFSRSVKSLFRNDLVEDLAGEYGRLEGEEVLMVRGSEDASVPLKHFEAIEKTLPEMRSVVLEGTGHSANYEEPDAVNALIHDFLSGSPGE